MTPTTLLAQRLTNQHISSPTFDTPEEVVQSLAVVQAQDYNAAKWALALRTKNCTDETIEAAITEGKILRTHILRPTWHFVLPADIHWMLELTAPRIAASFAGYYRRLELDAPLLKKTNAVIAKALRGGKQLTRPELNTALEREGIETKGFLRSISIIGQAELDGVICSGARRGKQFTYALLAERAPNPKKLKRDEALYELTRRYFSGHGPATLRDYTWWSGLSTADAKKGIALCAAHLTQETFAGETYWLMPDTPPAKISPRAAFLLPNFDEYIVAYNQRSAILDAVERNKLDARGNVLFNHTIVMQGKVIGTWKRTLKKSSVALALNPFQPLTSTQISAVMAAAKRYGNFLGLDVEMK